MHNTKKLILFYFFLSASLLTFSQNSLDSLYGIWQDESQELSTRAIAYLDYIYEKHSDSHPDSILPLGKELYDFSVAKKYDIGVIDALILNGYAYFESGRYPEALAAYKEGLEVAKRVDDQIGIASILLKIGFIYHDNGDLNRALDFYQRSEAISEKIDDIDGLSAIYNEFGTIYREQEDYVKSLEYYEKSLKICLAEGEDADCSAQYSNMGSLLLNQQKFTEAKAYYQKALKISEANNSKLGIAGGFVGIGMTYFEEGNNAKALEFLNKARKLDLEIGHVQGLLEDNQNLAEIYTQQKKYAKAIRYCKESLELARSLGDIDDQMLSCQCLYTAYKGANNPIKALQYLETTQVLKDSLNESNTTKKLQNIEFDKRVTADSLMQVEKNLKIAMAHQIEVQENEENRNIAIAIGIFFLLLAGGFYTRYRLVNKSKKIIEKEKDRSENLLLNILPAEIAEELKIKGKADARDFDLASILFTDFKGFTQASEKLTAQELIAEINHCFKAFDYICEKYGIEKIKTIGDAYMAAGGLPKPSAESTKNTVLAALEMQAFISQRMVEKRTLNEVPFEMRLGVHTGPVVAGIVGVKKFQYDIWGDTVNTASRMESGGEISKVNISETTYKLLKEDTDFLFEFRGDLEVKGKGKIKMYFVTSKAFIMGA